MNTNEAASTSLKGAPVEGAGQSYADKVNAPLSQETLEALRAALASEERTRFRRPQPRDGSSGS